MLDNRNCNDNIDNNIINSLYNDERIFGVFILRDSKELILFSDLEKEYSEEMRCGINIKNISELTDINKLKVIFDENNILFLKKEYVESWELYSEYLIEECMFRRRVRLNYLITKSEGD